MKITHKILALLILYLSIYSCSKDSMKNYTLNGNWEIVSYKINGKEQVDSKKFYSKKFTFSENIIRPLGCDSCDGSQDYVFQFRTENNEASYCHFSSDFMLESSGWRLIPSQYKYQFDINPLNYKSRDTMYSFNGYAYSWEQEYLSGKVFKINNLYYSDRVNDITITFEKH